jgi:hypothetical protein
MLRHCFARSSPRSAAPPGVSSNNRNTLSKMHRTKNSRSCVQQPPEPPRAARVGRLRHAGAQQCMQGTSRDGKRLANEEVICKLGHCPSRHEPAEWRYALSWKIAPLEQMVVCTAEGTITLPDMLAYFRALDKGGAFPYQKIFIATAGVSGLSQEDLGVVAHELQSRRKAGRFGEVAYTIPIRIFYSIT